MSSSLKGVLAGLGVSALLLAGAAGAAAATYTVTRTDDPEPGACLPTDCSLREGLMAANGTTAVDDVVIAPASAPYFIEYDELTLFINDEVEVRGAAADKTLVIGDGKEVVFTVNAKTTLSGLTITGGKGGIQSNADLTLRGVSVIRNEREAGGGGIQSNGPLTLDSSFVGFNHVKGISGGGIQANAAVTLLNSTVAWNSSEGNGGILGNAAVTAASSAIIFNSSEGAGVGVTGLPLTVLDSIFAGNRNSAKTHNCGSSSGIQSLGGNVSDDATCGAGAIDRLNVSPGLGTLDLHGGTTPVYDLLAGSPAIDAASQCPAFDQRGMARPHGVRCDSGPYESIFLFAPPPPPGDGDFSMRLGKKLRLAKNAIWVRLTCPKSEASPPCRGKVVVKDPPLVFNGPRTMQGRPLSGRFTLQPGKTKAVALRRPRSTPGHLPKRSGTWRVALLVSAEDAAGNDWKFVKRRALLIHH